MTTYAITGATGHLGWLVIEKLLSRGVPAGEIVAVVRAPEKAAALAEQGVIVRKGDYSAPETLPAALAGVDVLLLVSASEIGQRLPQHHAVVDAAKAAGVGRIVYTSLPHADTSQLSLAPEHKGTEEYIRASGIPYTFLRNGSYFENFLPQLDQYLATGVIVGATDDAPVAGASRADLAEAAAVVLTTPGHEGAVYELGGAPFTQSDLAAAITEVTGTPVAYHNVTVPELVAIYTAAGMDEHTAAFIADFDAGTATGDWNITGDDLAHLLGRPPITLTDAIRAAHT